MSRKAVVNSGGSSLSFVNKGSEGFLFYFSLKPKQENPFCVLQDAFLPVSSSMARTGSIQDLRLDKA